MQGSHELILDSLLKSPNYIIPGVMHALNYKTTRQGACLGISMMGANAIFLDYLEEPNNKVHFDRFKQRLKIIETIFHKIVEFVVANAIINDSFPFDILDRKTLYETLLEKECHNLSDFLSLPKNQTKIIIPFFQYSMLDRIDEELYTLGLSKELKLSPLQILYAPFWEELKLSCFDKETTDIVLRSKVDRLKKIIFRDYTIENIDLQELFGFFDMIEIYQSRNEHKAFEEVPSKITRYSYPSFFQTSPNETYKDAYIHKFDEVQYCNLNTLIPLITHNTHDVAFGTIIVGKLNFGNITNHAILSCFNSKTKKHIVMDPNKPIDLLQELTQKKEIKDAIRKVFGAYGDLDLHCLCLKDQINRAEIAQLSIATSKIIEARDSMYKVNESGPKIEDIDDIFCTYSP